MTNLWRRNVVGAVIALAVGLAPNAAPAQTAPQRPTSEEVPAIGVAQMRDDGTIVLYLRATGPGGVIGTGLFEYPPAHPRYQEVLRHLGGMKPGEVKNVPPWPD